MSTSGLRTYSLRKKNYNIYESNKHMRLKYYKIEK